MVGWFVGFLCRVDYLSSRSGGCGGGGMGLFWHRAHAFSSMSVGLRSGCSSFAML